MRWKDVKIARKLYFGFGAVLILTVAVGYVGWNGLGNVETAVTNADDANRLIKWAYEARQQEKNFILRGDATIRGGLRLVLCASTLFYAVRRILKDFNGRFPGIQFIVKG